MGILAWLVGRDRPDYTYSPNIVSPWAEPGNLQQVIPSELFGAEVVSALPLSREEALTIPAVSKARNLLVSTISKFPLKALDKAGVLTDQPTFLYRDDDSLSTYDRTAATVDDLIFYGRCLWTTVRGAAGQITSATWLPIERWTITNGNVLIDEQPVSDRDYILFHVPRFDGLLAVGKNTLRGARDTEKAWVSKIQNPIPATEISITDDSQLEQDEVDQIRRDFVAKHKAGEPAVVVTPQGVELRSHGEISPELYVENRNAIRTDVGSFTNIRAAMLDGTIGIDSLTYTTTEGTRNLFYEIDLPFWTAPIEAALSVDKVVPRGQRVRFDKYEAYNLPVSTGIPTEDD